MSETNGNFYDAQNPPVILSAKDLQVKKTRHHKKKVPLRLQKSKPPKSSVKVKQTPINIHFKWALVLTILCFFIIGPCWALYKTVELRRLIKQKEFEAAERLSNKMSTILLISTIIGAIAWTGILFGSIGLILTGILLKNNFI